jgi:hypothetical protein
MTMITNQNKVAACACDLLSVLGSDDIQRRRPGRGPAAKPPHHASTGSAAELRSATVDQPHHWIGTLDYRSWPAPGDWGLSK